MVTPKLRFKEFDKDWCTETLGNIAKFSKGKGISKADISVDGASLCIRYGELYTTYGQLIDNVQSKTDVVKTNCTLSKAGDVIIPASGETQIAIATAACVLHEDIILGGDLNVLNHEENGVWLAYYLSSAKKLEMARLAQGNSVVHLYSKQLKDLIINKPCLEEQAKIASFLSTFDTKVGQLTQEYKLLNEYKKGMVQQFFSQRVRFKADDGSSFEDWKKISLVDFLEFNPRPINKPEADYHALGIRSHFKGLFNKFDSDPKKNSMDILYEVEENDVVVNITFAWEGAMAIAESEHDKGLVSHRFPTYSCNTAKVNRQFFKYVFTQKEFLSHLQLCSPGGAGRNRVLNKKDFLNISFYKPCLEEQTKIANFLSAIDQKIDNVAAKIDQAKEWKKGLLQQMFV